MLPVTRFVIYETPKITLLSFGQKDEQNYLETRAAQITVVEIRQIYLNLREVFVHLLLLLW